MHITSLPQLPKDLHADVAFHFRYWWEKSLESNPAASNILRADPPSHILVRLWGLGVISSNITALSLLRSFVVHRNTRTNNSLVAISGATDSCTTTRFAERARDDKEVAMSFRFKKIFIGRKGIKNRVTLCPPHFPTV